VYEVASASVNGQPLKPSPIDAAELEAGKPPIERGVELYHPVEGRAVEAAVGDVVKLELRTTRKRKPVKVSMQIVDETLKDTRSRPPSWSSW
jgi:hypothetical protein